MLSMKAVILAGGYGTRIAEETSVRPKPMIEIGGKPILWHIMKIYAHYGVSDFIVCLGYKGYMIKEYFANQVLHNSDVTIDNRKNKVIYHGTDATSSTHVHATFRDGTVTLMGAVETPNEKDAMVSKLRDIYGVVSVEDELVVKNPQPSLNEVELTQPASGCIKQ